MISDTVWLGIIGALVMVVKEVFDRWRAADIRKDAAAFAQAASDKADKAIEVSAKAKEEAKKIAEEVAKESKTAVGAIAVEQKEQHLKMNSKLEALMATDAKLKLAEGVVIGRAQLQAELDAKTAAVAQAAEAKAQLTQMPPPVVVPHPPEPLPVVIVPASNPLPVKETP